MSYYIAQNQSGSLPQVYPFNVPIDGDVTIAFSGTCWSNTANCLGGVIVFLDGTQLGDVPLFFNAASQHMTQPTQFFPVTLQPGDHKITLQPLTGTTIADVNDFFSLWVLD